MTVNSKACKGFLVAEDSKATSDAPTHRHIFFTITRQVVCKATNCVAKRSVRPSS